MAGPPPRPHQPLSKRLSNSLDSILTWVAQVNFSMNVLTTTRTLRSGLSHNALDTVLTRLLFHLTLGTIAVIYLRGLIWLM